MWKIDRPGDELCCQQEAGRYEVSGDVGDVFLLSPEKLIVRSVDDDAMTADVLQADGTYALKRFRYEQRIDRTGFTLGKMTTDGA